MGLAVAGWLSADREHLVWGANLDARDHQLGADLRRRLQLPVVIENDGNATALGGVPGRRPEPGVHGCVHLRYGSGRRRDRGRAARCSGPGPGRRAGPYAGRRGGSPRASAAGGAASSSSPAGRALPEPVGLATSFEVVAAARAGDAGALGVLNTAGRAIGRATAVLVPVVDPDAVVLAGSLAHAAGEYLLPAARAALAEERPLRGVRPPPPIEVGRLGRSAGAIGAAELVLPAPASPPARGGSDPAIGHVGGSTR